MKKILILSLILATGVGTAAEDIIHLSAITSVIHDDTLVLFDVDDTLIQPTIRPSETAWGRALLSQLRATGQSDEEICRQLWSRLYLTRACGEMRTVEPHTAKIVADLQARQVKIMGLTARSPELAWITAHQLAYLGIHLRRTSPYRLPLCLLPNGACAGYLGGILYTARADKGVALEAFFQAIDMRPAHIVFVDDRIGRVLQVEDAANRLGIPCNCYHYIRTHQEKKVPLPSTFSTHPHTR